MTAVRTWSREEIGALAALGFLLVVSAAWWALALWPMPETAPDWLQTARAVCFRTYHTGLPDAGGWILLIGEPLGMLGALFVVWGDSLRSGLRELAASRVGRGVLGMVGILVVVGLGGAGWRVASAQGGLARSMVVDAALPALRVDRPAPPLGLVDQHGDRVTLDRFRGRPLLVTFGYAHCETVCPLLVRDALEVQRRLGEAAPALVVVTLDPWRDLPSRLPHIAATWEMGHDAFVLSGEVAEVEEVLAGWGVESVRDERTGELFHAPVTFVVDGHGRVTHATTGTTEQLLSLLASHVPELERAGGHRRAAAIGGGAVDVNRPGVSTVSEPASETDGAHAAHEWMSPAP